MINMNNTNMACTNTTELVKKLGDESKKLMPESELHDLLVTSATTIEELSDCNGNTWISAKDKLPEYREMVLVWYQYYAYGVKDEDNVYDNYDIWTYHRSGWFTTVNLNSVKSIYWMPLPKNPMGKEVRRY